MAQSILVKSKEIRVKNTNMVVEDENRAEVVEFSILNAGTIEGVSDMAFYVQYRNKLDEVGMDVLVNAYPSETIHNDMLVLDWLPSATFSKERGKVEIQIVGFTRTLEPTEDTTYKSGKIYFTENGEFIPVYPATSTHSPKVGDAITGTVYENEMTTDDHRWSSEKAILTLPENIYDNGTPIYTEEQVKNFITELNEQITIAKGYAEDAEDSATASATSASEADDSADSAETNALKSEGFAVGEQNGTAVGSDSPYKNNNSKYYAGKSLQYAASANVSSQRAGQYAEEADNARINSVSETESQQDGGTNVITLTYKDGTVKTFTVKNGHTGAPFAIYKTYSSISEMNADFANVPEGKFVCIASTTEDPDNAKLYVRGASEFTFITDLSGAQGIQGPDGIAATITVGSVTSGATASVTNVGTSSAAVFDFVLPKGDQGDQGEQGEQGVPGPTPVITIGSVTYGDTPTVTIDTTDPAHPVLDFVLKTSEVGVVDNLTSNSQVDALSAKQGKVLKGLIDSANSKINQHESRIENLEQKAGDYTTVQYRGTNAVPTGKAKNGLVESIVGKSRAWNQLQNNGDFSENSGWGGRACSVSIDTVNKIATLTVTSDGTGRGLTAEPSLAFPIINGHKYYLGADINAPISTVVEFSFGGSALAGTANITANVWNNCGCIISSTQTTTTRFYALLNGSMTTGQTIKFKNAIVRDLTLIFGAGNEPSTVADALAQLPALGEYNAYDAGSLVDTEVSGVKSVGVNIWDEEWEVGSYNTTTGEKEAVNTVIRCKNAIECLPNAIYHLYVASGWVGRVILYYDSNGDYIGYYDPPTGTATFTTPSNARYMRFRLGSGYGNVYLNNVQISEVFNNTVTSVNTTYHPYKSDTLSLSETVTLRSAGSVADTDELNVEVLVDGVKVNKRRQTTRVGSIVLDGSSDENYGIYSSNYDGFPIDINGMSIDATNPSTQLLSDVFIANTVRGNSGSGLLLKTWTSTDSIVAIFLCGTGETTVAGLRTWLASHVTTINFKLATPTTESIDPILDNFIEVEGGGTIDTIQEQSPVIDNCLDVGYLTV